MGPSGVVSKSKGLLGRADVEVLAGLWIRIWQLVGPSGVVSKSKGPLKYSQAKRRGAMVD